MLAIWIAARDRRTPWVARILALLVAGYALSPIDLVPDFIPVLGHLDDLLIVPLGLWLVIRLIPAALLAEFRARAEALPRPRSWLAASVIVALWVATAASLALLLKSHVGAGLSWQGQAAQLSP